LHALSQLEVAGSGYGVDTPSAEPEQAAEAAPPTEAVQGKILEKQPNASEPATNWQHWLAWLMLGLFVLAGAMRQVFYSYRLREIHR